MPDFNLGDRLRRHVTMAVGVFCLMTVAGHLPTLLDLAAQADARSHHKIPTVGDDLEYQLYATNILSGFGYNSFFNQPLEAYNLDLDSPWGREMTARYAKDGPVPPEERGWFFYRTPGVPLLLAGVYAIFGNRSIVSRHLQVVLAWLAGLLTVILGMQLARGWGAVAGGLAALHFLHYDPAMESGFYRVLSEIPAAFFVVLFGVLLVQAHRTRQWPPLVAAALALAGLFFVRGNLVPAGVFVILYLITQRFTRGQVAVFAALSLLPALAWCGFASVQSGRLMGMTMQGRDALPACNNVTVLEGIGPNRLGQGVWQPQAPVYDDEGNVVGMVSNEAGPGEDPVAKTLAFWRENLAQVPRLFYVKLRAGSWYMFPGVRRFFLPRGIFLVGVSFLLLAIGFRRRRRLARWPSAWILGTQITLVVLLLLLWQRLEFWQVLIGWGLTALLALLARYGDRYAPPFPSPTWFLALVMAHFLITIIFIGHRYYWPLNPPLMLFGLLGLFMLVRELWHTRRMLAAALVALLLLARILGWGGI